MSKKNKIILVIVILIIILCLIGLIIYFIFSKAQLGVKGEGELEEVAEESLEINVQYDYISELDSVLVTINTNKNMLKLELATLKDGIEASTDGEILEENYDYTLDNEFVLNENRLEAIRYFDTNETLLYKITFEDNDTTFEYITISQVGQEIDEEALVQSEELIEKQYILDNATDTETEEINTEE